MRRATWILLMLCIVGASAATAAQDAPGASEWSGPAYLDSALNLMQTHSLHRDEIDWTALRAGALERARTLDSTSRVYPAIRWAIEQLGDHHSWFWTPERVAEADGPTEPGSLAWYMVARGRRFGRRKPQSWPSPEHLFHPQERQSCLPRASVNRWRRA